MLLAVHLEFHAILTCFLTLFAATPGTPYAPRAHKGPRRLASGTVGASGSGGPTTPHGPGNLTSPRNRQVKY
jgi:hypothetical protein